VSLNLRTRDGSGLHPILGDPVVRRALVAATDRVRMTQSVYGTTAKVPPAPIPEEWSALWFSDLPVPPYDTALAARELDQRGWRMGSDGVRHRGGRKLAFTLAVPSTSPPRRQYAQLIQEELRAVGVEVTIDAMDNVTLQGRLHDGAYDAAIESWATDPTPSSGVPQMWMRDGDSNFGHYASEVFDRWARAATMAPTKQAATRAWRAAFAALAEDAPAIVLSAQDNVAAVDKRVTNVRLRPDSYWAYVRDWRIAPGQLIARDRVGR
jgi:peptide/nickel transport system substrate-binding protein